MPLWMDGVTNLRMAYICTKLAATWQCSYNWCMTGSFLHILFSHPITYACVFWCKTLLHNNIHFLSRIETIVAKTLETALEISIRFYLITSPSPYINVGMTVGTEMECWDTWLSTKSNIELGGRGELDLYLGIPRQLENMQHFYFSVKEFWPRFLV